LLKKKSQLDLIPIVFVPIFVPYRAKLPMNNQLLATMYASYLLGDSFLSVSEAYQEVRFLVAFPQSMTPVSGFFYNWETLARFVMYREQFQDHGRVFWSTPNKNIFNGDLMGFSFHSSDIEAFRNAFFSEKLAKKKKYDTKSIVSEWGLEAKEYSACQIDYAYDLSLWGDYESFIKTQKEKKDLLSLGIPVQYPNEFRIGIGFDEDKNKKFGEHALMAASFDKLFGGI
jgi:hypothetical protein